MKTRSWLSNTDSRSSTWLSSWVRLDKTKRRKCHWTRWQLQVHNNVYVSHGRKRKVILKLLMRGPFPFLVYLTTLFTLCKFMATDRNDWLQVGQTLLDSQQRQMVSLLPTLNQSLLQCVSSNSFSMGANGRSVKLTSTRRRGLGFVQFHFRSSYEFLLSCLGTKILFYF
jgi:hypothetical protein